MVKNPPAMQGTWVRSFQEDPLEKEMATHSCILARGRGKWQTMVHEGHKKNQI